MAGRRCSICDHPEREAIDRAIVDGAAFRGISRHYAVGEDAVARHRTHIAETLSKVKTARETAATTALVEVAAADEKREIQSAGSLLDRLAEISQTSRQIMIEARANKDPDTALKAIARLEKQFELEGRLIGELQNQSVVNTVTIGKGDQDLELLLSRLIDAGLCPVCREKIVAIEEEINGPYVRP